MPAFLYILLISKLCCCESLTSYELFDMYDPPNSDFELPTANVTGKNLEASSSNGNYNIRDNATISQMHSHTRTKIAKNISSSTYKTHVGNISNALNTSGIINKNITSVSNDTKMNAHVNDTSKIIRMEVNNTLSNNATAFNRSDEGLNITNLFNSTIDMNGTAITNTGKENATVPTITSFPNTCPEEEQPSNIGPYEIPTQRDTILHVRSHLLAMYSGFHTKAMNFLKDIKEATKASWSSKMYCQGPAELMHYRRCVRWVGDLAVLTTKSLVTALETMRRDVATLIQGKICNISSLSIDPIHLIRILAAERVSLEFALPDFLRQLHACASLCPSTRGLHPAQYLKTARLTNQDFVLRHYYTQQNYNQQLNQQYQI